MINKFMIQFAREVQKSRESKEVIINYLEKNIKKCKIEIIKDANHCFDNKGEELEEKIGENI